MPVLSDPVLSNPVSFDIVAATGSYAVEIDPGLLARVVREDGEHVFIADAFIVPVLAAAGIDPIVVVADEPAKSLDRMTDIIVALRQRGATRATTLVAVGGGVVQDIAAFAASVYMRGIKWTYVPTTLLSMADSCIGGKSSINVGVYKNIVGTIHPPVKVVIDPALTRSLSIEQKAAGLCEAAKICFCRSPATFDAYLELGPAVEADDATLAAVLNLSLRTKKWFIEIDEFDRAERLVLNFGHTFGHAIEAASGFAVGHGIAVGLGILAALHLGEAMGRDYRGTPAVARLRTHLSTLLTEVPDLAAALARTTPAALIDAFQSDKKHSRTEFAVIIVTDAGVVERRFVPRDRTSTDRIVRAFAAVIKQYAAASVDA